MSLTPLHTANQIYRFAGSCLNEMNRSQKFWILLAQDSSDYIVIQTDKKNTEPPPHVWFRISCASKTPEFIPIR